MERKGNQMNDKDRCPDPPTRNTLYVVFHGELAFVDIQGAEYIRVYAPKVPTHIYMAGQWLGENQIPLDTTLALVGVYDGGASTAHSKIISLGQQSESRPVAAHFEIRLPRPDKILNGYVIPLSTGDFTIGRKNPAPINVLEMDLRPIFQYTMRENRAYLCDLDDVSDLDNESDNSKNWAAGLGCPGYYALHIFAEEDIVLNDKDHTSEATECAGRILGVNEVLAHDKSVTDFTSDYPPGLDISEYAYALSYRTTLLADLGTQLRKGHRELTWTGVSRNDQKLRVDSHASCGPART